MQDTIVDETPLGPEVSIDIEPIRDLLLSLGVDVANVPDDLLGAMAYGISLVQQAPLAKRIAAFFPDATHISPRTVYMGHACDQYESTWRKRDDVRRYVIAVTEPVEANRATEKCPQCKGGGTHPDHDRGCPGGGPICDAQCPVEVLCDLCRGEGVVPVGSVPIAKDDDEPF